MYFFKIIVTVTLTVLISTFSAANPIIHSKRDVLIKSGQFKCLMPQERAIRALDFYKEPEKVNLIVPEDIVVMRCKCAGTCSNSKSCKSKKTEIEKFEVSIKLHGERVVKKVVLDVPMDKICECQQNDSNEKIK